LRSSTNGYEGKTHQTDSQNSDIAAPRGRELYRLQFSLEAASPETFGYTPVNAETKHVTDVISVLAFVIGGIWAF
jgi:hypothetical protein